MASFDFLAPAQAPDEIGRLGPYRVLKVLGKGGMGVVFRAEDLRLGRPVALKAMLPEVAQEPEARQRFLREARAVAALEHDNIIAIHQVDEDRGVPYIVMPLLKGMSLEDWLKTKQPGVAGTPLPFAPILRIGREIASGLAAAHAGGLIHRDIKPGNIWLDAAAGDRVKLLDFGLARSSSSDQNLTQSGAILGTPAYMAPEQAEGHKVDSRADLFSLGVVLYRLCTGQMPFHGPNMIGLLMALASHEPTPPQALNPGLPRRLSDLVMKLLAKDPVRRLGSAQEAVQELLAIEKEVAAALPPADPAVAATPAAPARVATHPSSKTAVWTAPPAAAAPRWRQRWPLVAAGGALVAVWLGIYLAATVFRAELSDKVKDPSFTVGAGRGVVAVEAKVGKETVPVALQPPVARQEPKQVGPIAQPAGQTTGGEKSPARPAVKRSDGVDNLPAQPVQNVATPLPANMGNSVLKAPTDVISSMAFSQFVSTSGDRTETGRDATTGLVTRTLRGHTNSVRCVAFSPDGKHLVSGSYDTTVKVWDATTGRITLTLQGHSGPVTSVAFSPDGKHPVSGSADNTVKVWDATTGLATRTLQGHTNWVSSMAFSPDGKRLVTSSADETVKVWDAQTGQATLTLTGHTGEVYSVAFSPDGKRLVSGSADKTVKVWDAQTGQATLTLTGHTGMVTSVAFSPDGRRLVTSSADKTVKVWNATGQDPLTLQGHTGAVYSVAFSPDSKRLVSGSEDQTVKVWDATTGQATLTLQGHTSAVWSVAASPDGKRLASSSWDRTVRLWDVDR